MVLVLSRLAGTLDLRVPFLPMTLFGVMEGLVLFQLL